VGFKDNEIANFNLGHPFPDRHNFASRFVSHYARDFFHMLSHPRQPLIKVDIAAAN
jgi:hypothetical protein